VDFFTRIGYVFLKFTLCVFEGFEENLVGEVLQLFRVYWHGFCLFCVHMNSLNAHFFLKSTSFSISIASTFSILKCGSYQFHDDRITTKFYVNAVTLKDIIVSSVLEKFLCHQARI